MIVLSSAESLHVFDLYPACIVEHEDMEHHLLNKHMQIKRTTDEY